MRAWVKGNPLRTGRVTHIKRFFIENLYFLDINVFTVSNYILWYLNMSSIDLATRFKIGMYLFNRENRYMYKKNKKKNRFSKFFFSSMLHDQTLVESL